MDWTAASDNTGTCLAELRTWRQCRTNPRHSMLRCLRTRTLATRETRVRRQARILRTASSSWHGLLNGRRGQFFLEHDAPLPVNGLAPSDRERQCWSVRVEVGRPREANTPWFNARFDRRVAVEARYVGDRLRIDSVNRDDRCVPVRASSESPHGPAVERGEAGN